MQVTMGMLAKETGLSTATVSCALRGLVSVRPETSRRVLAAANRLGYVRDPQVARAMETIRRGAGGTPYRETLAFLSPESDPGGKASPYWLRGLLAGARDRAARLGYGVECWVLRPTLRDQRRLGTMLRARGQRGVILAPLAGWTRPQLELQLPWAELAVVEVGHTVWSPAFDRVEREVYEDLAGAFSELVRRGYRRIGLVVKPSDQESRRWSVLAHYLVFQRLNPGLAVLRPMELGWPWTRDGFRAWQKAQRPDVIVTASPSVQNWLAAAGANVPGDVGVLRWDCGEDAADTGLRADYDGMGAGAVDVVVRKLELGDLGLPAQPRGLRLSHRWQEGATVRPAVGEGALSRLR